MNISAGTKNRQNAKIATIAVVLWICLFSPGFASEDIWFIDTHSCSWHCASEQGFQNAIYYQLVGNKWIKSNIETFLETQDPEIPLVVFSPGYTSTTSVTIEVGMELVHLYQKDQKCRTVFWCWPADKIRLRLAPDIREKISVAEASGQYLSHFLRRLKPESKVCMIGFSFGNRIICDAVQNLGDDRPENMRIHLVLTAAATDRLWLSRHSRHGDLPRLTEKILILYNPADRALKFYPYLYGDGSRPDSLGRYGPVIQYIDPEYRNRIEDVNVNRYLGKYHRTVYHLQTPVFRQRMNDYLFFGDAESSDAPTVHHEQSTAQEQ